MFTLDDFNYDLPPGLIAQEPVSPRDSARLMLLHRTTGRISHHHVYDLPHLPDSSWAVVANNTKVFPARLLGHKSTGGKVEVLLLHPLGQSRYKCLTKPGLNQGTMVSFSNDLIGTIIRQSTSLVRESVIEFNAKEGELKSLISLVGSMPTPPYIKKMLKNVADYQTIYAKYGFSAAAPTAGLHFTPELLTQIKREYPWFELTLDVGLGTFLPVKETDITKHHMHQENFTISPVTAHNLNQAKKGHRLLAIGTTTTRALESSLDSHGNIIAQSKNTSIYLYPPYQFHSIDGLLTNFHLPGSTLLMMVSAFTSYPNSTHQFTRFQDSLLGHAYQEAIKEKYRFFSFGDAMLII